VATPIAGVAAFTFDGVYIGATWSRDMRNMMLISLALFLTAVAVLMPIAGNHGLWAAFLIFLGARGASLGLLMPRRAAAAFAPA
jgi:MATE family multidrug resistance protein